MDIKDVDGMLLQDEKNYWEQEIIRLAIEYVIANRENSNLMLNAEYRELSDTCESELSRRASFVKSIAKRMGRAVQDQHK